MRFITADHGVRKLKDAIGRDVLDRFDEVNIALASTTFAIVGLPPVRIEERFAAR